MTLKDVQQSFYSRDFDVGAVAWLLGAVAIVVGCIVAFILVRSILARRVRYQPHGSITDQRMIRNVIRQAFDQRRPFEVQVQTDSGSRRPTLRCSPEYMGSDSFTVEISGLKSLSDKWLGRAITVFFRIQAGGEFTYYTFASRIDGIHLPKPGMCHITLPMPTALENRQKRSFLRMPPPPEFLMGSAIWHGASMPPPEKISDISLWPRPQLLLVPDRLKQFQIVDLSAGGARLSVPSKVMRSLGLNFASVEQLVLMLDLFDPEQNRRLRFWLQCRIQSVWVEHVTHDANMGVQFVAWARPKDVEGAGADRSGAIEWLRLSGSNEVEPIGNWIMRRHLELFREIPQDFN